MQQISLIVIYPVFGQFISFCCVKTTLQPSSNKCKFSSTWKTFPVVKKVKGNCIMLRASICYKLHYLTCYLTHNFVIARKWSCLYHKCLATVFCSRFFFFFQKVGSHFRLCNVCYSKNENVDDALSFCLTLDRTSRGGYSTQFYMLRLRPEPWLTP